MTVYLLATLDTKGPEAEFVRTRLTSFGVEVQLVDTGCLGPPQAQADVARDEVFRRGGATLEQLQAGNDRGAAVQRAADGAAAIVREAWQAGRLSGVLGLGGSAGTAIGTRAMQTLPIGVPKLMVSTLASGDVSSWVGAKDILMLNPVVDIAGLNRITRRVLGQAAAAMAGLVQHPPPDDSESKPLIAATMFGVTTPCVQHARQILEEAGYEVLVFHATGSGGRAMESLIADGLFAGVLDLTTTELADEHVGGVLSAGPERLTAAGQRGVPQVISVGATDMVNFGPRDTVPESFGSRNFHVHNAHVTLMRTTPEECSAIGREIGVKAASSGGSCAILLPLEGVSAIDKAGESFDDPHAREALFAAIRAHRGDCELVELPHHINDPAFAEAAAQRLLEMLEKDRTSGDA